MCGWSHNAVAQIDAHLDVIPFDGVLTFCYRRQNNVMIAKTTQNKDRAASNQYPA